MPELSKNDSDKSNENFFYFAFGSNLLTERIHINNPSAIFVDTAKLEEYRLEFNYFSKRWRGAAATINSIETCFSALSDDEKMRDVYGVLWELNIEDRPNLDFQEGVKLDSDGAHIGVYRPLQVEVRKSSTGEKITARTYQLIRPLEEDRRPSKVYMDVIKKGAKEHNIPEDYLQFLESIEHNGYDNEVDVKLNLFKV